jgi:1-acyl-sn-glycerol-3-phosphate acyltransferase
MRKLVNVIDYWVRVVATIMYFMTSLTTSSLILFYANILGMSSEIGLRIRALFAVVTCAPWMLIFGVRLSIVNEHLVYSSDRSRKTVNIGTHASHLDGLAMMVAYWRARQFRFPPCAIVKRDVLFTPFYGIFAYLVGNVLVSRSSSKQSAISSMSICADRARKGFVIGAFPEGTRRRTPSVGKSHLMPFKKGAFHLVSDLTKNGVPVTISPFCLIGSRGAWPIGRLVPVPGAKVTLVFLPQIQVADTATTDDLLAETRSVIEEGVEKYGRNKGGVYDSSNAFDQGVEVDLMNEFGVETVLLMVPPVVTIVLAVMGWF